MHVSAYSITTQHHSTSGVLANWRSSLFEQCKNAKHNDMMLSSYITQCINFSGLETLVSFSTVSLLAASIQVIKGRRAVFRVQCISTGGRALSMTVTGPDGFNSDLSNIQPVGDPQGIGDDEFSASTDVISGGRDGNIYQCTASNGVSSDPTNSVELRGNLYFLNTVNTPF